MKGKKYKNDFILIAVLFAAALLIVVFLAFSKRSGSYAEVKTDKKVIKVLPLNKDTTYIIQGKNNGTNTLVIKNGYAYLESASCPDKLCVHMGKINKIGQSIICLPNKVVVEIKGTGPSDVDFVAG